MKDPRLDLLAHAHKYPAELSGGQVQRLNFVRALAAKPSLLLCDEPFSALDEITRLRMQRWLLDVWQTGETTILFVTHSIEEALFLSDRVVVIKDGRIRQEFDIAFARPRTNDIRFTKQFIALRQKILSVIE